MIFARCRRDAQVLTDNLNRAAAEVRTVVGKGGGKMADPGSVLFNFERKGLITLSAGEARERPTLPPHDSDRDSPSPAIESPGDQKMP